MSRTFKHIKQAKYLKSRKKRWETDYTELKYEGYKYIWPDFNTTVGTITRTVYLKKAGVHPKRRRSSAEPSYHYPYYLKSTPMWWIHLFMNRPQRRKCRIWEREAIKYTISKLEELDKPSVSRKPHLYYW